MTNCLTCEKCGRDKKRNAVCNVNENKQVPILAFNLYDSENEFRTALFTECGTNCDKYEPKVKKKTKGKKETVEKVKVPQAPHVGMVRGLLGCTGVLLAVLVPLYVYFLFA